MAKEFLIMYAISFVDYIRNYL